MSYQVSTKLDLTLFYDLIAKKEIERLVKEMLNTSINQTSYSSFASLILLVKNKDGTWRLCIDCR